MDDWGLFLEEVGLTQEIMDEVARKLPPPLKEEDALYFVSSSDIAGRGIFVKQDLNGFLGVLRIGDEWTVAGRYANHSPSPNTVPIKFKDQIAMYGEVNKGEEITLNYRDIRRLIEHS